MAYLLILHFKLINFLQFSCFGSVGYNSRFLKFQRVVNHLTFK